MATFTFQGNYYKNGELLYSGIHMFLYGGFLRAVSVKKNFLISMNQRVIPKSEDNHMLSYFFDILWRKQRNIFYNIQEILNFAEDYDEALKMIQENHISSPFYFNIIGVSKENGKIGCI